MTFATKSNTRRTAPDIVTDKADSVIVVVPWTVDILHKARRVGRDRGPVAEHTIGLRAALIMAAGAGFDIAPRILGVRAEQEIRKVVPDGPEPIRIGFRIVAGIAERLGIVTC